MKTSTLYYIGLISTSSARQSLSCSDLIFTAFFLRLRQQGEVRAYGKCISTREQEKIKGLLLQNSAFELQCLYNPSFDGSPTSMTSSFESIKRRIHSSLAKEAIANFISLSLVTPLYYHTSNIFLSCVYCYDLAYGQ